MNRDTISPAHQLIGHYAVGQLKRGVVLPGKHCYRLEHLLHVGRKSAIYLATDLRRQREVIVKEGAARPWQPAPPTDELAPLEQQAEMLRLLKRWQIPGPRCLDLFPYQGGMYLVMTRLAGDNLDLLAEMGQITSERAIKIVIQVGKIVQRLHGRGYAHHDLHPANIMIQPDGQPVLVDYSAAGRMRRPAERRPERAGLAALLAPYQRPEQATSGDELAALARTLEVLVPRPDPGLATMIRRGLGVADQPYRSIAQLIRELRRGHRREGGRSTWLTAFVSSGGAAATRAGQVDDD